MQDSTASISLIANLSLVPAVAQHIPSRACFGGIKIAMCAGIANRPRAVQELTYSNRIPRALLNKHCMTSRFTYGTILMLLFHITLLCRIPCGRCDKMLFLCDQKESRRAVRSFHRHGDDQRIQHVVGLSYLGRIWPPAHMDRAVEYPEAFIGDFAQLVPDG